MIADLDFVAMMHRKPLVSGAISNSNENAGVGIRLGGLVHNLDRAVAEFFAGIPKKAHVPLGAQQPVLYYEAARTDMLPSVHVLAVEQLLCLLSRATAYSTNRIGRVPR